MWDGGYDIVNDLDGVLTQFDKTVGLSRLRAVHINDSMNPLGAHKDRHAKIGEGHIGFEAFRRIINHPALRELPFMFRDAKRRRRLGAGNRHAARSVRGIDVMAKSRGRFFKRPLLFAEEDSPVLERPEQIMVDLVGSPSVKTLKTTRSPGEAFKYSFTVLTAISAASRRGK